MARAGFDTIAPERHREICAMGGRSVPPAKRKFATDPEWAREIGRRAGLASAARRAEIARRRREAREADR